MNKNVTKVGISNNINGNVSLFVIYSQLLNHSSGNFVYKFLEVQKTTSVMFLTK